MKPVQNRSCYFLYIQIISTIKNDALSTLTENSPKEGSNIWKVIKQHSGSNDIFKKMTIGQLTTVKGDYCQLGYNKNPAIMNKMNTSSWFHSFHGCIFPVITNKTQL